MIRRQIRRIRIAYELLREYEEEERARPSLPEAVAKITAYHNFAAGVEANGVSKWREAVERRARYY